MALLHIVPREPKIDFVGLRFVTFLMSTIVVIATIITLSLKGINYGIDFKGGLILEIKTPEKPDLEQMRKKLEGLHLGEVSLQNFGGERDLILRIENDTSKKGQDEGTQSALTKVKSALGSGVEYQRVSTIGPKVGDELVRNAMKAIAIALVVMLGYISVRFEWQFAACAIVALAHDCIAIIAMFSIFPLEFNETSIIAILITAGYSINDTIVIFDRIRENIRKYKKMELKELINKSVNETLSRTLLTATTTLLALLALYFFGGKVISMFSLPILVGIIIGSFSSICLAAPLLLYLNVRRNETTDQTKA